jgi:methyl-accepting chemotaxis protein
VLVITVVGVMLFVVLCRLVVRRQMQPLRMLTRSAQRVAEGHYDETVPRAERDDEIGALQDLFRRMQQSLAAKSTELEQLTKRLNSRSEELRKALGSAQGSDRMKTSFLHYMTTQMTVPSDLIERSVMKLSNNYDTISPQEADFEVTVIKEQSEKILDLLDHMVEALTIEAEEAGKAVKERKEEDYE